MQMVRTVVCFGVLVLALAGCAGAKPTVDFGPHTIEATAPSAACEAAGETALAGIQATYGYLNTAYDQAEADGEISREESSSLLDLEAQASDDIEAAVAPTFSECHTAGEWLGLVRANPGIAELTKSEAVTDQTLEWHCPYFADTPVCRDAAEQGVEFEPAG